METTKTCRECGGRMERGFVADANYGTSSFSIARWFGGTPSYSWHSGLKVAGKRVKMKDGREVAAFRCERCGALQNYVLTA